MKREVLIGIIVGVLVILAVGLLILTKQGNKSPEQNADDPNIMVDCGQMKDFVCFSERMEGCMPVTGQLKGPTEGSIIEISILGEEDGKCHFERKKDDILNVDCYFPKEAMKWDIVEQLFGIEKGLKNLVDESCTVVNVV